MMVVDEPQTTAPPQDKKKILHLTLYKKFFDQIYSGKKTEEYREDTPYWTAKLTKNGEFVEFDEVHFKNGYGPDVPFMAVEHLGTTKRVEEQDLVIKKLYVIKLGEILLTNNIPEGK